MSQSTLIVGGLMAAFIVWVTLNKHLGNYFADLGLGSSASGAATTTGPADKMLTPGSPFPSGDFSFGELWKNLGNLF